MTSVILEDINQNEIVHNPKAKNTPDSIYLKITPKCSNNNDALNGANDQFTFLNISKKGTSRAVKIRLTSHQLEGTEKLRSPALLLDSNNEKLSSPAPQSKKKFFQIMKKQYQFSIVNDEKSKLSCTKNTRITDVELNCV